MLDWNIYETTFINYSCLSLTFSFRFTEFRGSLQTLSFCVIILRCIYQWRRRTDDSRDWKRILRVFLNFCWFTEKTRRWIMTDLDRWIDLVKDCRYLPENDLKKLCDIVCEILLEESNIQPVTTPVTVCGDIHGQVSKWQQNE